MKVWRKAALVILGLVTAFSWAQSKAAQDPHRETMRVAMDQASLLMDQALKARKEKRLDEAEHKCRAAIKVLGSAGWVPQGETQWLGIVLFEKGKKQEGLKLMKIAFERLNGTAERELIMANF